MEYGLQVFDADGNCILDVSTVSTKLVGFAQTGKNDGAITDDKLIGKRFWVRVISCDVASPYRPWFSFDETTGTISWRFAIQNGTNSEAENPDCRFMYGTY